MLKGKQWKRMLAILLTMMVCVQLVPMDALRVVKATTSEDWEYYTYKNEVEISSYKGSDESVTIPSEIEQDIQIISLGNVFKTRFFLEVFP